VVSDTLTWATRYVGDGLSAIPLRPGDKRPAISWEPYQHRRATQHELKRWFADGENNIGIVTGEISGLVVVDLDGDDGERSYNELGWSTDTRAATTWSGGVHFYFAHPGKQVGNRARLRPGLDIRADRGYVVAPPSQVRGCLACSLYHEKCICESPEWELGTYLWITPLRPLRPLPANPDRKPPPEARSARSGAPTEAYLRTALQGELGRVAVAIEGTRNDELNVATFAIARFVADGRLSRRFVEDAFLAVALRAGLPESEARRTIRSAIEGRR
jgi:hypothetical protein